MTNARRIASRKGLRFLLAGCAILVAGGWAGGMREDELLCEEAAARLVDCCPDFDPSALECVYSSGCGSTQYPAIPVAESECILERSCSELAARGICARAQNAKPEVQDEDGGVTEPHEEVCP